MTAIDISRLSTEERLDLIEQLWVSLDSDRLPLSPAQQAELDRRIATADADLADGISWAKFRTELADRLK